MNNFDRLAPFIQDFIYSKRWESLRDIQIRTCDEVFDTDKNILLAASTASGKTEAAFLPTITKIYNDNPSSVGILYISPLKALINDQFLRINDICADGGIKVTKWHGDVGQYIKDKLIKDPSGILQTTPESLEATTMRNVDVVRKLFSDLRFIIIDEVHHFMNDDRGDQLRCTLERIQKITENTPRRIGLSATLGDYSYSEKWLNSGTGRDCSTICAEESSRSVSLSASYYLTFPLSDDPTINARNENTYFRHLYDITKGHRCIIFSNSKAEVETNITRLKELARINNTPDIYNVHHGSISADLRESTERLMKDSDSNIVTGATLTLELGIDLGSVDRIVQTGAPYSVASFVQRLGRSGRRNNHPEMAFTFLEHAKGVPQSFFKEINWPFIRTIAIIELYLKEQWLEPSNNKIYPFSLLFHQTLSHLYSHPDISPARLAQDMLTLTPFKSIDQADFKELLLQMIKDEMIEKSERGGLLIGLKGERTVNNYDFYSVFKSRSEYKVRYGSEEIGTVTTQFEPNMRFVLAGKTWNVDSVDEDTRSIFVSPSSGMADNHWNGFMSITLHTKILKKMREVLASDEEYGYLTGNARSRLKDFRTVARRYGADTKTIVEDENGDLFVLPWLGTKALFALSYALQQHHVSNSISNEATISMDECLPKEELVEILDEIRSEKIDKNTFAIPSNIQPLMTDKYNRFVPMSLLRKQFISDYLDVDDMQTNLMIDF